MTRTLLTRALPVALTAALVAALWVALAPPQLGGRTVVAAVYGTSMEPKFQGGDVVVLRKGGQARVGDVVGYQSAALDRLVVHRVLRVEGGKLVLKGDNNAFVDPGLVSQSAVVGGLMFHVPAAGRAVEVLHTPWVMAVAGVLAAFFLMGGGVASRRRGRERPQPAGGGRPVPGVWIARAGAGAGALVLAAAALAAFAYSHSATSSVDAVVSTQTGTFGYAADAPPAVYGGRRARTGDPVFLLASGPLELSFSYQRTGPPLQVTRSLAAELTSPTGWRRTLLLSTPDRARGRSSTLRATLDLRILRRLVDRLEARTGVNGGPYTLRILARIAPDAAPAWTPSFGFTLDAVTLKPLAGDRVSTKKTAERRLVPAELRLGRFSVPVVTVRLASAAASALGFLVFGLLLALSRRAGGRDEAAAIARRLRGGLVTVERVDVGNAVAVVELGSIDELIAVAEEYQRLVLHEHDGGDHVYTVAEDRLLFRYVLSAPQAPRPALEWAA